MILQYARYITHLTFIVFCLMGLLCETLQSSFNPPSGAEERQCGLARCLRITEETKHTKYATVAIM